MSETETASEGATPYMEEGGASRQARLATAVGGLRRRASGDVDRWLLVAGAVLLPLGTVLILLGWHGVAHSPFQVQQTSYLISGGILGLALVIAGGFLYFGYWLTRLVHEGRRQNEQVVEAIGRLEERLVLMLPDNGQRPAVQANGALVATPSGTMAHRPDCPVVVGRQSLRPVPSGAPGFDACKICQPELAST